MSDDNLTDYSSYDEDTYSLSDGMVPELIQVWKDKKCLLCNTKAAADNAICNDCNSQIHALDGTLKDRLQRLIMLQSRVPDFFANMDLPTCMLSILQAIKDIYKYDRSGIYLVDKENMRIKGITLIGLQEKYIQNFDIPIEPVDQLDEAKFWIGRKAATECKTVIVNDLSNNEKLKWYIKTAYEGKIPDNRTFPKSIAAIPLQEANQAKAVIIVSNMHDNPKYEISEDRLNEMEYLFCIAKLAILNAFNFVNLQIQLDDERDDYSALD